jgi:hypothetical protein
MRMTPRQAVHRFIRDEIAGMLRDEGVECPACCEPNARAGAGMPCEGADEIAGGEMPRREHPDRACIVAQRQHPHARSGQDLRVGLENVVGIERRQRLCFQSERGRKARKIGVLIDDAPAQQHLLGADVQRGGTLAGGVQERWRQDSSQAGQFRGK